jgi:hypothetical protein
MTNIVRHLNNSKMLKDQQNMTLLKLRLIIQTAVQADVQLRQKQVRTSKCEHPLLPLPIQRLPSNNNSMQTISGKLLKLYFYKLLKVLWQLSIYLLGPINSKYLLMATLAGLSRALNSLLQTENAWPSSSRVIQTVATKVIHQTIIIASKTIGLIQTKVPHDMLHHSWSGMCLLKVVA